MTGGWVGMAVMVAVLVLYVAVLEHRFRR